MTSNSHDLAFPDPDRDTAFQLMEPQSGLGGIFGAIYHRPDADAGYFAFKVGPGHLNPSGDSHGGALMTFADICQGRPAQQKAAASHRLAVTVSMNVDFLAATREGDWVVARTEITRQTRNLIFTCARMQVGTRPVASSHGIFALRDLRQG